MILKVFWVLFAVISHHSLGCLLLLCTLFWGSLWSFISSSAVMFECDSTPFRCWVEKVQQLLSLPVMLLNGLNLDEQIQLLLDLFVEFIGSHMFFFQTRHFCTNDWLKTMHFAAILNWHGSILISLLIRNEKWRPLHLLYCKMSGSLGLLDNFGSLLKSSVKTFLYYS